MQEMRQELQVQSLGQEDSLEEEVAIHSYPCLENPMDIGAWQAPVHGATEESDRAEELNNNHPIDHDFRGPEIHV